LSAALFLKYFLLYRFRHN